MWKFNVGFEELSNIVLQEIYCNTVGYNACVTWLAILEVSSYGENAIWVYQRKFYIYDGDGGFFILREIVYVQHVIKILVIRFWDHISFQGCTLTE